jgi:two-component system cell cycle sensor histidine kinase PleC
LRIFGTQRPAPSKKPSSIVAAQRNGQISPRIFLVTILLLAGLQAANALFIVHFYDTNAAREGEAREATATLLAEHAAHAFTAVDLTLQSVATKIVPSLVKGHLTILDQALLSAETMQLPQLVQMGILDKTGHLVLDSEQFPAIKIDLADRAYFTSPAAKPNGGLYIGRIINDGHFHHSPHFTLSRPIVDDHGGLLGVATALMEPSYFSGFYSLRRSDSVETELLVGADGAVLAGHLPNNAEFAPGATTREIIGKKSSSGTVFRDVPGFSLKVAVAGPTALASPAFRNFVIGDGLVMLLVTVVALWLARALASEANARTIAENRLRDAIENGPVSIALYDFADRLVLCNKEYVSYHPPAVQPLLVPGLRFETLVHANVPAGGYMGTETPEAKAERIKERIAAHRDPKGEMVQQIFDGRWLLTRERRTAEGGTACFYTDITLMKQQEDALRKSEQSERQAREAAERADRTKSSFLATMSHELRTPLNAVIGFSQIIEQSLFGPQPARYREYAGLIRRSGEHLLSIINDILDIAKLQSGKTELHLETAALAPVVEETVQLMEPQALAAHVTLSFAIEGKLPKVRIDFTRIRQVMLNLLSNALKFTPAGGTVSVVMRAEMESVCVAVIDTGIGMSERDIPRALEPFGQISNALTRAHEGTGLGLPLAKNLIELHGGRFAIASKPGFGTTVTMTLPAEAAETEPVPLRNVG